MAGNEHFFFVSLLVAIGAHWVLPVSEADTSFTNSGNMDLEPLCSQLAAVSFTFICSTIPMAIRFLLNDDVAWGDPYGLILLPLLVPSGMYVHAYVTTKLTTQYLVIEALRWSSIRVNLISAALTSQALRFHFPSNYKRMTSGVWIFQIALHLIHQHQALYVDTSVLSPLWIHVGSGISIAVFCYFTYLSVLILLELGTPKDQSSTEIRRGLFMVFLGILRYQIHLTTALYGSMRVYLLASHLFDFAIVITLCCVWEYCARRLRDHLVVSTTL